MASGDKMLSGTEMDSNFFVVLELRGPPASGLRNVGRTWLRRHESARKVAFKPSPASPRIDAG